MSKKQLNPAAFLIYKHVNKIFHGAFLSPPLLAASRMQYALIGIAAELFLYK